MARLLPIGRHPTGIRERLEYPPFRRYVTSLGGKGRHRQKSLTGRNRGRSLGQRSHVRPGIIGRKGVWDYERHKSGMVTIRPVNIAHVWA